MKKVIFSLLIASFLIGSAFAGDKAKLLEINIISETVKSLTNKEKPEVCLYNFSEDEKRDFIKYSNLEITDCENAKMILVKGLERKISFEKPAFALDYISFKKCQNCIGAFYWRKGRPQIVLIKEMIEYFKIKVPDNLKFFIVSKKVVMVW